MKNIVQNSKYFLLLAGLLFGFQFSATAQTEAERNALAELEAIRALPKKNVDAKAILAQAEHNAQMEADAINALPKKKNENVMLENARATATAHAEWQAIQKANNRPADQQAYEAAKAKSTRQFPVRKPAHKKYDPAATRAAMRKGELPEPAKVTTGNNTAIPVKRTAMDKGELPQQPKVTTGNNTATPVKRLPEYQQKRN